MLSAYVPYFLSAIAGGVGVGLLWWLAERRHEAVVRDLLKEEMRLSNEVDDLRARNGRLFQNNVKLHTKVQQGEVENRRLAAQLAPFTAARARRGANGKFVRAAA